MMIAALFLQKLVLDRVRQFCNCCEFLFWQAVTPRPPLPPDQQRGNPGRVGRVQIHLRIAGEEGSRVQVASVAKVGVVGEMLLLFVLRPTLTLVQRRPHQNWCVEEKGS